MRYHFALLPLAALTSALVLPDQHTFKDVAVEAHNRQAHIVDEFSSAKDDLVKDVKSHYDQVSDAVKDNLHRMTDDVQDKAKNVLDEALAFTHEVGTSLTDTAWDVQSWAEQRTDDAWQALDFLKEQEGPPHHGRPPHDGPPHHGPPPHKPRHPPHHGKPNQTVYELISKSKYTTKLAKLINDYPDLIEALNGTAANYTIFAPTDRAFEKIPDHAPKPTKEQIERILQYHVSPHFYPAGRLLLTHTLATLLKGEEFLEGKPQRLRFDIGVKGLLVNLYSRVVAVDIFATNGVIHGVDTIIVPPPKAIGIIDYLPSEFSTLEVALAKTDLLGHFNDTEHPAGTLFAPSNFAFWKLGPKINGFLFSKYGTKYLKALLLYHIVPGTALYSDAIYRFGEGDDRSSMEKARSFDSQAYSWLNQKPEFKEGGCHKAEKMKQNKALEHNEYGDEHHHHIPKGYWHYTLDTAFADKQLEVDVARYGRLIAIKINGFSHVSFADGVAQDGVINVVGDVLIPPKNAFMPPHVEDGGSKPMRKLKNWLGEKARSFTEREMTVEEFKSRFEGLVEDDE